MAHSHRRTERGVGGDMVACVTDKDTTTDTFNTISESEGSEGLARQDDKFERQSPAPMPANPTALNLTAGTNQAKPTIEHELVNGAKQDSAQTAHER